MAPPVPAVETRLITSPDEPEVMTVRREVDVRTALARGLAEYLSLLSFEAPGGREVYFREVLPTWPESEDKVAFPSAYVGVVGPCEYGANRFTAQVFAKNLLPDGSYGAVIAELEAKLRVEMWATDPEERMALVMMLEDGLNPVDWIYGTRLCLPYYHGMFADYALDTVEYEDGDAVALQRYRKAILAVSSQVSVVRTLRLPVSKTIKLRATVT